MDIKYVARGLGLGLALAAASAAAQQPQVENVAVVDHGIYTATTDRTRREANGISESTVSSVVHALSTREVPAQLGVRFGFRYVVLGSPSGATVPLRIVTIFPPGGLQPSPGKTVHRDDNDITVKLDGSPSYHGYVLDHGWELVKGTWTFEVWSGGRKLASQSFDVVAP